MKSGSDIYYFSSAGETFPGVVLKMGKNRIKIKYNGLSGDVIASVKAKNIRLPNEEIEITENRRLSEIDIKNVSQCLRDDATGKSALRYIGKIESADTGDQVKLYTDKNGLLTI